MSKKGFISFRISDLDRDCIDRAKKMYLDQSPFGDEITDSEIMRSAIRYYVDYLEQRSPVDR